MATPDRHGVIQATGLLRRLREAACDLKPRLLILDNAADIFGGNENDRGQVRQFIGILRGLAMAAGCGVLLTSHPSLTGIASGSGLSGSTAWNASVRSRLYFKKASTPRDDEPDPDLRVLEVMKSNYGPVGQTITLRWNNGLFLPVTGASNLERLAAEQTVDNLFLVLLARFTRQGRNVSDKRTSNGYAPSCFASDPEAKAAHVSKQALANAMDRLFASDKIHVETYGRPSRQYSRLVAGAPHDPRSGYVQHDVLHACCMRTAGGRGHPLIPPMQAARLHASRSAGRAASSVVLVAFDRMGAPRRARRVSFPGERDRTTKPLMRGPQTP